MCNWPSHWQLTQVKGHIWSTVTFQWFQITSADSVPSCAFSLRKICWHRPKLSRTDSEIFTLGEQQTFLHTWLIHKGIFCLCIKTKRQQWSSNMYPWIQLDLGLLCFWRIVIAVYSFLSDNEAFSTLLKCHTTLQLQHSSSLQTDLHGWTKEQKYLNTAAVLLDVWIETRIRRHGTNKDNELKHKPAKTHCQNYNLKRLKMFVDAGWDGFDFSCGHLLMKLVHERLEVTSCSLILASTLMSAPTLTVNNKL